PARSPAQSAMPARTPIPGGSYVVVKGDTLYSIAFRKGVDFRDLAQWNGIAAPYTIWPGQRLTLSPPAKSAAVPVAATPGHAGGASAASAPAASAPVFESVVAAPATPPANLPATASTSVPTTPPVSVLPAAKPATPAVAATAGVVPVAGMPTTVPATMPPPAPAAAGV